MHRPTDRPFFTPPPQWADLLAADACKRGDGFIAFRDLPMSRYRYFAELARHTIHDGKVGMTLDEFSRILKIDAL